MVLHRLASERPHAPRDLIEPLGEEVGLLCLLARAGWSSGRALTAVQVHICVVENSDGKSNEGPLESLNHVHEPNAKRIASPPRRDVRPDLVASKVCWAHIARDKGVRLGVAAVSCTFTWWVGRWAH